MVYRPPFIKQLDGTRYAGLNCTMAAAAMAIVRDTRGRNPPGSARWYPTPSDLRAKTGDRTGGTNLEQAYRVSIRYYGVNYAIRRGYPWHVFYNFIKEGRGAILQGSYEPYVGTVYDGSRAGFDGNHAVFVNEVRYNSTYRRNEYLVYDPLYDGRRRGIPRGPKWIPEVWLKRFAAYLQVTSYRKVGSGYFWAAFTRDTEQSTDVNVRKGGILINPPVTYYSVYQGANVRLGPWLTSTVVDKLNRGEPFTVYQRFDRGSTVDGSRIWFGDRTGKRWIAKWNVGKGR